MAVASETASPILNTANLISMCESRSNLDKLYERKFDKIPIFDEEDDETVIPEKENGYKFTLDIHKFYQFVQFGGRAESQVSLGSGIDHSSNLGFIVQEKDNFDREFYFFQSDECDPALYWEIKAVLSKSNPEVAYRPICHTPVQQGEFFLSSPKDKTGCKLCLR